MQRDGDVLYFVGKMAPCAPCDGWHFEAIGVFSTPELATAACLTTDHFVGPLGLNESAPEATTDWPGCWFPLPVTPEPQPDDVHVEYKVLLRGPGAVVVPDEPPPVTIREGDIIAVEAADGLRVEMNVIESVVVDDYGRVLRLVLGDPPDAS